MSSPSTPSTLVRVFAVILSALALFVWLQTVIILSDMTGSDAAGNGMAQGFAAIGLILLWIVLAVLALLAFAKGEMPRWAALAALMLIPASGFASMGALHLLTRPSLPPHYWPIVVPALAPLLIIVFCLWAIFPSLRGLLSPKIASGGAWGAVLALCVAMLALMQIQQNELDARAAARARYDAALAAVPSDAPLWELTPFLSTGNYQQVDTVLARIRKLDRRQTDAETMLTRGDLPLRYLGQMDLTPTPSLCDKTRALLRQRVTPLVLTTPNSKAYREIAPDVEDALAALRWLIAYDCPAMAEAQAWQTMAEAYRDTTYSVYELRDLRDPKALGAKLREDPDRFDMLTPKAHLKAWLKFADYDEWRTKAIEGARTLDHRTANAVDILGNDEFLSRVVLENLARLDLEGTPALCKAALGNLHKQFDAIYRPPQTDAYGFRDLTGRLGRGQQFQALIWLASHGCDARAEIDQAIALIKAYGTGPDGGLTLGRLEAQRK